MFGEGGAQGGGGGGLGGRIVGGNLVWKLKSECAVLLDQDKREKLRGLTHDNKFARASHLILILTRETADLWGLTPAVVI